MKVFGIGMFKTGTTSLGYALDILGYKTLHGPWWGAIKDNWYEQPSEWKKKIDVFKKKTRHYNAFQDFPWMYLYKEMDQCFPNSRFILTTRDAEKVAESDLNMWKRNGIAAKSIPDKSLFIKRYLAHKAQVLNYFRNKDNLLVVNWENGDGWKQLCDFLEKPVPSRAFPHVNKGGYEK